MCNFLKEDVLIVAKAIVEDPLEYSSCDRGDSCWCMYCGVEYGYIISKDNFKHEINCPVRVAMDLLT